MQLLELLEFGRSQKVMTVTILLHALTSVFKLLRLLVQGNRCLIQSIASLLVSEDILFMLWHAANRISPLEDSSLLFCLLENVLEELLLDGNP